MAPWLEAVPKWWQILVAFCGLLAAAVTGSVTTAKWLGWEEAAPTVRIQRLEVRDSLQQLPLDTARMERKQLRDSMWQAFAELQRTNDASLRLLCAQTPELYQRLAKVNCR